MTKKLCEFTKYYTFLQNKEKNHLGCIGQVLNRGPLAPETRIIPHSHELLLVLHQSPPTQGKLYCVHIIDGNMSSIIVALCCILQILFLRGMPTVIDRSMHSSSMHKNDNEEIAANPKLQNCKQHFLMKMNMILYRLIARWSSSELMKPVFNG